MFYLLAQAKGTAALRMVWLLKMICAQWHSKLSHVKNS